MKEGRKGCRTEVLREDERIEGREEGGEDGRIEGGQED